MCGVAGSWQAAWDVEDALRRIRHRGPDAQGVEREGDVVHGHVRLSILDLDARSDQPYRVPGGLLSYVGECWNYRELRRDLEVRGVEFVTEGDTEVVARTIEAHGVHDALLLMRGQYALAWTETGGDTWLARDRLGEVPLYLREADGSLLGPGGVTWASERRAWDPPYAADAVAVPAGHYVRLGDVLDWRRYYEPRTEPATDVTPGLVLSLVEEAVEDRLQADVPVAFLASGGLDSSLILAIVARNRPDVVAYRARLRGRESRDWDAAERVCQALGVELRDVEVDHHDGTARDAVRVIETPMKAQVEIAGLCLPLAERISRDGFRVVLSGEGADELFGGYGNLARKATSDAAWVEARRSSVAKQSRANCVRTNKAFMAHAVEARLPFLDHRLVDLVLPLGLEACPPGKGLLKDAARGLVPDEIIDQPKRTFQGGAGAQEAADDLYDGEQVRTYNDMARDLFGGIPRDGGERWLTPTT